MPKIIPYEQVLRRMTEQGFVSLYHNSGAFGFAMDVATQVIGWIGPDDPTIRADARLLTRNLPPPYEINLARLLLRAWRDYFATSNVWVMPMSHWSFELDFASSAWLPEVLREIEIDPTALAPLNNAAAIEFDASESAKLERLLIALLTHLASSDFAITFTGQRVLCPLHHHKQLWWTTDDRALAEKLRHATI